MSWTKRSEVGYALIASGLIWFGVLVWTWRPVFRLRGDLRGAALRRAIVAPLVVTLVVGGIVTFIGIRLDAGWLRVERADIVITALALVAGGVVAGLWLPAVDRCVYGRVDRTSDAPPVRCPRCRDLMTGLTNAVCPECGEQYTLDRLLAAQGGQGAQGAQDVSISKSSNSNPGATTHPTSA